MNKTFKKITAAVMAVASLAVGMVGGSISAAEISPRYQGPTGYVYFGPSSHAKAGTYADSSQINLSTNDAYASRVTIELTDSAYATLTRGEVGLVYASTTSVSFGYQGTDIRYAAGEHTAKESGTTYSTTTYRSVG